MVSCRARPASMLVYASKALVGLVITMGTKRSAVICQTRGLRPVTVT